MGVATTQVPLGFGTKNSAKKLSHAGVLSGHNLSQNHVPKISDPGSPLNSIQINNAGMIKVITLQQCNKFLGM